MKKCSPFQLINDKQGLDEPELFELEEEHIDNIKAAAAGTESLDEDEIRNPDKDDDDEDDDDMASPLNPEAKEFVPISPQRESPFSNGSAGNQIHDLIMNDKLLSQSPRKNLAPLMNDDNIELPSESDFSEIANCPAEVESPTSDIGNGNGNGLISPNGDHAPRPGSASSQGSYQEMNLKERMHGDEKQEFAEELLDSGVREIDEGITGQEDADPMIGVVSENDIMNASFYNDGTNKEANNPFSVIAEVDMNAVQTLPDDSSEENENFAFDGQKPRIEDLLNNEYLGEYVNGQVQQEGALENGSHYVIQDTDFGMNQQGSEAATPVEEEKHISHQIEQISNGLSELCVESNEDTNAGSNDVPLSASISEVVHELASQVTSVLKEFSADDAPVSPVPQALETGSIASEQSNAEQLALSPDPFSQENVIHAGEGINDSSLSAYDQFNISDHLQEAIGHDSASVPVTDLDVPYVVEPSQGPEESVGIPEREDESIVGVVAAGTVAAVAAVAAAAVSVAATKSASPKTSADAKKPDVKARTSTTSSAPAAAKKTSSAPLKSARPPAAVATSKTSTAAKPAALSARTVRLAPAKAPIEKKTAATTTSTAAKKPLTNGTTVRKTTTTVTKTTAAKPLVSAAKTASARTNLGTAPTAAKPATVTAKTSTLTAAKPSTLSTRPASSTVSKVATTTR